MRGGRQTTVGLALWRGSAVLVLLLCAACGDGDPDAGPGRVFATKDGAVELTFPSDWAVSAKEHPYDLQVYAATIQMTTGVFVYTEADLGEDRVPEQLLDHHVDDLRVQRKRFELVTPAAATRAGDKTLTTVVYSGVRTRHTNIYRFTLIEFDARPRMPVIVIQSALPELWPEKEPVLAGITRSARLAESK